MAVFNRSVRTDHGTVITIAQEIIDDTLATYSDASGRYVQSRVQQGHIFRGRDLWDFQQFTRQKFVKVPSLSCIPPDRFTLDPPLKLFVINLLEKSRKSIQVNGLISHGEAKMPK
jgi:hypothetical protein